MRLLRQVFCRRHGSQVSAKIIVLSDVRLKPASSSWPIAVCTSGRRIVLNAGRYSAATDMSRARPSGATSSVVGEVGIDDLS